MFGIGCLFFISPAGPWPDEMQVLLEGCGIIRLYSHQVSAIDKVDYFIRVRSNKTTEILEVFGKKGIWDQCVSWTTQDHRPDHRV